MTAQFDISAPPGPRGRQIKFTPERMQQIRNLVERGMSREEIAATIGVTVGSLQVTCSKAGISLRKSREPKDVLPRAQTVLVPGPLASAIAPAPARAPAPEATAAALVLRLEHNGQSRDFAVPVTVQALSTIALTAAIKGLSMGEVLAKALTAAVKDGVL